MLSVVGMAAASLLAVPTALLMVSEAEAQTAGMERRQERREGRQERRQTRRTGRTDAGEDLVEAADEMLEDVVEDLPGGSLVGQAVDLVLLPGRWSLRIVTTALKGSPNGGE